MKIVIAIDSYKGCCSSQQVSDAVEKGFRNIFQDVEARKIAVADGGEGTVDILVEGLKGRYQTALVVDPLGRDIQAEYGILPGGIAVIEMAAASGLPLLKSEEYNPMVATTYGTGQLVLDALNQGCQKIYVGLGGSATNDGGVGLAQALGVQFYDDRGMPIGFGGGALARIQEINISGLDPRIRDTEIVMLSDVTCPLCGPTGASVVFGPQKGATTEMIEILDENLRHLGDKIKEALGKEVTNIPGAGAGGGLGASVMAFCNAVICPGVDEILRLLKVEERIRDVDLVITGEGRIDSQTVFGKVPIGIAKIAKKYGIPVIAIVGSVGDGAEEVYKYGIDVVVDIVDRPMVLEEALASGEWLVEQCAKTLARTLALGKQLIEKTA